MKKLALPSFVFALVACGSESPESKWYESAGAGSPQEAPRTFSSPTNEKGPSCTKTVGGEVTPVDMIVMYDQSGSMGDTNENPTYDPAARWVPVATAMKSFFGDARSGGLSAQLTFFANAANSCEESAYANPEVALAALPDSQFATVIDTHKPKGDTPTKAAVLGALAQARANATAHPDHQTVVVLVTDGDPWGCGVTSSAAAKSEVQDIAWSIAAANIPLYVVGVGPDPKNVDLLATAGGTTAFHVEVGNAQTTTNELVAALESIAKAPSTTVPGACIPDVR